MATTKSSSKATGNSAVKAAMKLFDKLMAEKKPMVGEGFREAVERSMTGAGADAVNRRMATAYLSKPFKEIAEKISKDRGTAIAFASAAVCIKSSAEKYKTIADLMGSAEVRIHMALCQREDMQEILAEAAK